jgi:hypothetical protein
LRRRPRSPTTVSRRTLGMFRMRMVTRPPRRSRAGVRTAGPLSGALNQRGGPLAGTVGETPEGNNFLFVQGSAVNTVSQNLTGWQEGYRYDLKFYVNVRQGAPGMDLEVRIGNRTIYGPVASFLPSGLASGSGSVPLPGGGDGGYGP